MLFALEDVICSLAPAIALPDAGGATDGNILCPRRDRSKFSHTAAQLLYIRAGHTKTAPPVNLTAAFK
jgi:hypothetical protein